MQKQDQQKEPGRESAREDTSTSTELGRSGIKVVSRIERDEVLNALIEHSSDAIMVLDEQFLVRESNPAARTMLKLPRDEEMGWKCREVLRCKNLNRMELCGTSSCPLTRALQQHGPLPNEELVVGSQRESFCEVSASVTPVDASDGRGAVFTVRDLSALKVASQVRANFVSMVSHELRTPLNSVHGFIELLLQGHMGELTEEQRLYLGYTQEGVQQLISIVEDILFMTRSDLGQFETRQQGVQLYELVRLVTRNLQPQALKAGVALVLAIPQETPLLYIDPQRIKQVLNNLIANAIKYTPPGGSVTVTAREHDAHFQMITVTDTGYGIPLEDRPHIFERFYQSNHSQQSKMGGYGLGLAIARLIVEQHGGTISFDTALEKGSSFYFTLPIYEGARQDTL
ncbi:sensor histidine kinase [Ktedonospora formicarum]|nr:ATP-binding protein [Ktedonospora formicarum]